MKKILPLILLINTPFSLIYAQSEDVQPVQKTIQVLPEANKEKAALDLQKAYQKEYAFLTAQVKNIKARTIEFKKTAQLDKGSLNQQMVNLENKLLNLDTVNNQLDEDLFQIERNTESAQDNKNLLSSTITQAQSTYQNLKWMNLMKTVNSAI